MTGRICVITGASGGIGRQVCKRFIQNGDHVVMVDISKEKLDEMVDTYGLHPQIATPMELDISKEEAVREKIDEIVDRFSAIDVLVNTAGICGRYDRVVDQSFEQFQKIYEVNVFGTFLMMKYVLKQMEKQGRGCIVNFGSVSGMRGYSYEIAYGSSKWAVIGMSQTVANEYGLKGIRCNSVSPGWVDTCMMEKTKSEYEHINPGHADELIDLGPSGRAARPEEIADVVYYLCGENASYINGANIVIDGGKTTG